MSNEPGRTCPICGADARDVFTSIHDRRIFECSNRECGHFFTPVVRPGQGVSARDGDLERQSDESLRVFDERNVRLLSLCRKHLREWPDRIAFLDLGAGDAHVSRTFKRLMADRCVIYCLEPDPACAPFYRQWGLIPVASLEAVPEAIDFAYLIEVVEHLEHPVSTLRRLRQVLSPGGRVLLSTPEGSRCPRHTNAYDDPTHLHFFTPRSLNRALSAAGFEPLDFRRHPEMYSLPARRLGRVLHRARAIARPFLLPLVRRHVKYGHLAGVTRPR